jgi:hypothetical protein
VCIVTSAGGEQYIADSTIEQFGFDAEMWFMNRSEYHALVCGGGGVKVADAWCYDDMHDMTSDVLEKPILYKICQATRKACGVIGDETFSTLQVHERMTWVRNCAIEALMHYD